MTRRPTPSAPAPLRPTPTPNLNPNPNLSTQAGKSIAGDLKSVAGRSGVAPSEAPTRATGVGGGRRVKVDPKEVAEKQKVEAAPNPNPEPNPNSYRVSNPKPNP